MLTAKPSKGGMVVGLLTELIHCPFCIGRGVKTRQKGLEEEIAKQLDINSRNLKSVLLFLEITQNIRICKKT